MFKDEGYPQRLLETPRRSRQVPKWSTQGPPSEDRLTDFTVSRCTGGHWDVQRQTSSAAILHVLYPKLEANFDPFFTDEIHSRQLSKRFQDQLTDIVVGNMRSIPNRIPKCINTRSDTQWQL